MYVFPPRHFCTQLPFAWFPHMHNTCVPTTYANNLCIVSTIWSLFFVYFSLNAFEWKKLLDGIYTEHNANSMSPNMLATLLSLSNTHSTDPYARHSSRGRSPGGMAMVMLVLGFRVPSNRVCHLCVISLTDTSRWSIRTLHLPTSLSGGASCRWAAHILVQ